MPRYFQSTNFQSSALMMIIKAVPSSLRLPIGQALHDNCLEQAARWAAQASKRGNAAPTYATEVKAIEPWNSYSFHRGGPIRLERTPPPGCKTVASQAAHSFTDLCNRGAGSDGGKLLSQSRVPLSRLGARELINHCMEVVLKPRCTDVL